MKRSSVALLVAGLLGYGALALLFPRVSPVAGWRYEMDRRAATAAAEAVAGRLGVNVRGWPVSVAVLSAEEPTTYLRSTKPGSDIEGLLTPLQTHVLFGEPGGPRRLYVRLAVDGKPTAFARLGFPADRSAAIGGREAARAAISALVGDDRAATLLAQEPQSSAAAGGESLTFSMAVPGTSDFTLNATAQVKDGVVIRASIGPSFSDAVRQVMDRRDSSRIGLGVVLVLISFLLATAAIGFGFWGALRREVHYRSAIGLAVLIVVVALLPLSAGAIDAIRIRAIVIPERIERAIESTRDERQRQGAQIGAQVGQAVSAMRPLLGLLFVPFWFAGYPLARRAAPELAVTARDFFSGRLRRRPVGRSIAAGVVLGGAVAAIPYLLAASGIAPAASLDRDGVDLLVLTSRFPFLIAYTSFLSAGLLVLFGFAAPLVDAHIPQRILARAILVVVAAVLLAAGSPFAFTLTGALASGLCLALLATAIYTRFDLLTLLTAGAAARIAIHGVALAVLPSPGLFASGLFVFVGLTVVGLAGLLVARRGTPVDLAAEASTIAIQVGERTAGDRERLRAEFSLARRVQEQMLPEVPPAVNGFGLAATCRPAREVGGDLYEFIPLDDGRFLVAVADVSGKGVPAALYMTLTKGLLGAVVDQVDDPEQIARSVNEHLYEACARKTFVTLALGVLDTSARTFRYARAGHNPPIWRRTARRETEWLRAPGIGLGLVGPTLFNRRTSTESIDLERGDTVVLYSDGIVEAMNSAYEEYGDARLVAAIERADGLDALALRDSVLADVQGFIGAAPPHDDMTLVVLTAGDDDRGVAGSRDRRVAGSQTTS